jgi:outer membrane protein assembly factor BamB
MKKFQGLIVIYLVLSFGLGVMSNASAQLSDTPWPMFKHDLRHTSQSPYSGPEEPIVKWMFSTPSKITTPPTIGSDGTLYVSSDDGMYAINHDGTEKWKFEIPGGVFDSQPAIALDGTIYILAYDGYLYAINPNGTKKWRVYIGNYVSGSSPAVGPDGTVYVAGANGDWGVSYYLFAINPTGTEKWAYSVGGGYPCGNNTGPAIGPDGTIYVDYTEGCDVYGGMTRAIHAVYPAGTLKWKYSFPKGTNTFGVAIASDNTICITTSESLHAFNPDGTTKWIFAEGVFGSDKSRPSIASDGTIYFHTDYLYAVNPDGTQRWRVNLGINPWARKSPTIDSDGIVYVQGYSAGGIWQLWAINSSGTQKWVFDDFEMSSHGAVLNSDGTIYITSNGTLKAIGGAPPQTYFEENDPAIIYTGSWIALNCPSCSGGALKYSNQTGAKADFTFNGTGIKWIVTKAKMLGKAKVYLDGMYMGMVDLYGPTPQYQVVLQKTGLSPGTHTCSIEVSGQKNPSSTGYYIDIDAFEVVP